MKKVFLFCCCLHAFNAAYAQRAFSFKYADVSNFFSLAAAHEWSIGKHHGITVGLNYIITPSRKDRGGGSFFKASYPENLGQHFSGLVEYDYGFKPRGSFATFGYFYQALYSYSARSVSYFGSYGGFQTYDFSANHAIQQYAGLSVSLPIYPKLQLKIMGGFGADYQFGLDRMYVETSIWSAARMYSVGFVYRYDDVKRRNVER